MRIRPSGRPCANGFNNRLAGNSCLRDAFSDPLGNSRQCRMDDLGGSTPFSAFGWWCLRDTTRPPSCALRACFHCSTSPGDSTGARRRGTPPLGVFRPARARMARTRAVRVCFHLVGATSRLAGARGPQSYVNGRAWIINAAPTSPSVFICGATSGIAIDCMNSLALRTPPLGPSTFVPSANSHSG